MSGRGAWLTEERETHLLGLARVAMALLMAIHASKLARAALSGGYFGDYFHVPLVPQAWVPSKSVYLALLGLEGGAALLAAVGFLARPALLLSASIGLFLFCCDRLNYHNNRYLLHLLVFLLAFTPCDRTFRLRGPKLDATARRGPIWAQRLLQIQISLVYLASAGSKLVDADWRGGQVLHIRYQQVIALASKRGHTLPDWSIDLLGSFPFAEITSKLAISTELFVGLGFWFARTRALALWLGVLLHFGIELSAHVEIFGFLMWASYLFFAVPELRERKLFYDPARAASRALARSLRFLDWLSRFEITPSPVHATAAWGLSVVDRDGRAGEGLGALALVARGIPLFFPLWLPLAALRAATRPRISNT